MNHLIIYMHPTVESFNGAILRRYTEKLEGRGHHVNVRLLSEQKLNPALSQEEYENSFAGKFLTDVQVEHQYLRKADCISFLFPFWWGGFPAVGKGYIDRVLSYGVAYELDGENPIPLLKGKKAAMIFTSGTPEEEFKSSGIYSNFIDLIDKSIFQFCGIDLVGVLHFGDVIQCDEEKRMKMLNRVEEFAAEM